MEIEEEDPTPRITSEMDTKQEEIQASSSHQDEANQGENEDAAMEFRLFAAQDTPTMISLVHKPAQEVIQLLEVTHQLRREVDENPGSERMLHIQEAAIDAMTVLEQAKIPWVMIHPIFLLLFSLSFLTFFPPPPGSPPIIPPLRPEPSSSTKSSTSPSDSPTLPRRRSPAGPSASGPRRSSLARLVQRRFGLRHAQSRSARVMAASRLWSARAWAGTRSMRAPQT